MPDISTNYMGLTLRSPIIASSSSLTGSLENIKALAENGVGAVVLKSVFEEEIILEMEKKMQKMMSQNFIYPETMEFYSKEDVDDILSSYLKLISDCKKETDIPIIASVNCVTADNWTHYAKSIQDAGADGIEINVFSVPSPDGEDKGNEKIYLDILKAVKKEVSIPVAVKIGKYFANIPKVIKELSENGADAVVLFNRFFSPDIDVEKMTLVTSNVYSDPSEYMLPLRWVALSSGKVDADLSATTGIHDGKTVVKLLLAGAQTVQIATVLYQKGFEYLNEMTFELEEWMQKKDYDMLEDFRGKLDQSKVSNPASYLRFQFMKHISEN
jgi:dihydroorotate dehydrogenase (fumarate)